MKQTVKFLKIIMTLLCIIIVLSCVSGMPAPESGDDTLLIVLTENRAQGGVEIFYYYELTTDRSDTKIVVTPKKEFCITNGLPSGNYSTVTFALKGYTVSGYSRSGSLPPPKDVNISFQLKPGYITIFPIKFIYQVKMSADNNTMSSFDFEKVTEQDITNAMAKLSEMDGFSEWKNDYGF